MDRDAMLRFLLDRFVMHSPKMDGKHSWRFESTSWPMNFARGSTIEEAIQAAMDEEKRYVDSIAASSDNE